MLRELQTHFMNAIYDVKAEKNILSFIQETESKAPEDLLSIYRGSIFGGLKKALAETFPVTKDLVGEAFFNRMLGQYIKVHPCTVQDLNDYGEELPFFISNLKQARSVPYLSEMALLEWHYNVSENSEIEKNNLDELSFLKDDEQERIIFHLAKGSALLQVDYPVDTIWNTHINNIEETVYLSDKANLFIHINNENVEINRLTDEQFYFLNKIDDGSIFSSACSDLIKTYPTCNVNSLLAECIQQGWINHFSLK